MIYNILLFIWGFSVVVCLSGWFFDRKRRKESQSRNMLKFKGFALFLYWVGYIVAFILMSIIPIINTKFASCLIHSKYLNDREKELKNKLDKAKSL